MRQFLGSRRYTKLCGFDGFLESPTPPILAGVVVETDVFRFTGEETADCGNFGDLDMSVICDGHVISVLCEDNGPTCAEDGDRVLDSAAL